jgi:hypothetical protein
VAITMADRAPAMDADQVKVRVLVKTNEIIARATRPGVNPKTIKNDSP